MSGGIVSVEDLSYDVQGRRLLDRIDLSLRAGELLAVVGPNGAGKSTLLRTLTAELRGRGRVTVFGTPPERWRPGEIARRRAVLAQHPRLDFGYDVLEVVLLGRIPHQRGGAETAADRALALACLERVGLEALAARNYLTLSGGEQQRVHLARALAQLAGTTGERLLVLDEPTGSLDLAFQHQVLRLGRELCKEGVGILAVLHDLNLAAQYADMVMVLAEGRVLACGAPAEVFTPALVRAAFGHDVLVLEHPDLGCPLIVSAS